MDEIPDLNVFMMCRALNRAALSELPAPYRARRLRRDELAWWKAVPFDGAITDAQAAFMDDWYARVYAPREALFFERNRVVCDEDDRPVATCFVWESYGVLSTIHWFKVVREHEGKGLGRALLSLVMRDLGPARYPVYLHTQPGSYRAIKLYSDLGFDLLSGGPLGGRTNDLDAYLPILERVMPPAAFRSLRITPAPEELRRFLATTTTIEL